MSRLRRRWTLRGRLLAGLLGLLAVVCVVIGFVSVNAVRDQTLGQVDRQLQATGDRAGGGPQNAGGTPGGRVNPRFGFGFLPGDAIGTLKLIDVGTRTEGRLLTGTSEGESTTVTLTAAQITTLRAVAADRRPRSVTVPGIGEYRVLAIPARLGTLDATLVTGLPLKDANSTISNVTWVILIVAAAGLLGAAVLGSLIVRLALRPLRRVADTASRVSELRLDRGEVALQERVPEADTDGHTEVGQVGAALNRMLGHVATALAARQSSEMRVRQFVADASHELRTPLAAIRGYAELTRRTGADLPEDVGYAMGRVESEARRMTGLVEDLLLLARLDSGRPLEQQPVDLTAVVIDAVSDAQVAGPEHPISLALPDEAVEVIGDPARLHQVLTNLLTNARTHTAAGTAIRVALRQGPGDQGFPAGGHPVAVIDVEDDGPGIPAELLPRVFERFARGDSARSRQAGSTGLGLAIVAAVTASHGGAVTVDSRPGRTAFAVTLPVLGAVGATPPLEPHLPTPRNLSA